MAGASKSSGDTAPKIFALRSYPRTNNPKQDKQDGRFQNPEFRDDGCSNSLTSVEKDNLVMNAITTSQGRQGSSTEFLSQCKNVYSNIGIFRRLTPKEIHQAHHGIACRAPHLHQKDRHSFILLNNILGGPAMNNILNLKIREKHGIAYQVDSNYSPFTDTGVFSIYLGTEVQQLDKALKLIDKELAQLREKAFNPKTLEGYKTQLKGQLALGQDSGSSLMFNNGKSLWVYNLS